MCQSGTGSGLEHWVDSGPIAAQCGLSTWLWLDQYHIFLTMLTHYSHTCDTFVTSNWSIFQSYWPPECYAMSVTRTGVHLNTAIRERFTFKNRDKCCNRNPDVHWTMSIMPKSTIVIMLTLSSLWAPHNDNLQRPRWWQWWFSVFSAMTHQILD